MKCILILFFVITLLKTGCVSSQNTSDNSNVESSSSGTTATSSAANQSGDQLGITKGVYGKVSFCTGDFMPRMEGDYGESGSCDPYETTIYIYEKLSREELNNAEYPYTGTMWDPKEFPTQPIKTANTNSASFYEIELEQGEYSIFVLLDTDTLYYNGSNSLLLGTDTTLIRNIKIDYLATY